MLRVTSTFLALVNFPLTVTVGGPKNGVSLPLKEPVDFSGIPPSSSLYVGGPFVPRVPEGWQYEVLGRDLRRCRDERLALELVDVDAQLADAARVLLPAAVEAEAGQRRVRSRRSRERAEHRQPRGETPDAGRVRANGHGLDLPWSDPPPALRTGGA